MRPLDHRLVFLLTAVFIVIGLVGIFRHEMWRDELQAWSLAKDSSSLAELYQAGRYEKHPQAWFLVLFLLSRLTASPVIMQLFHLFPASLSAYLVLKFFPFPLLYRFLLIFGYYLLFEYGIISRNYALGVLCLFLFCTLYPSFRSRPFPLGLCLFVTANTSAYGLIVAVCLSAALLADVILTEDLRGRVKYYFPLILAVLGVFLAYIQLAPMADSVIDRTARLQTTFQPELFQGLIRLIPRAYFPVPQFVFQFWNSYVLDVFPSHLISDMLLAGLILL